jgi:hypothetical protein
MRIAKWAGTSLLLFGLMQHVSPAEIIIGQTDDFEDDTTQDWEAGPGIAFPNPNPPVNVPNDGPAGGGDNFLQITSNGGSRAGSRLVAFNKNQWTGNYLSVGVTALTADLNNLGAADLNIRLLLTGIGGNFVSASSIDLAPSSGWQSVVFPLGPTDLTGGLDLSATLSAVSELRILHNPVASTGPPPQLLAQLGVDNLTAVPEPATVILLAFGGLSLAVFAWRRRATR